MEEILLGGSGDSYLIVVRGLKLVILGVNDFESNFNA